MFLIIVLGLSIRACIAGVEAWKSLDQFVDEPTSPATQIGNQWDFERAEQCAFSVRLPSGLELPPDEPPAGLQVGGQSPVDGIVMTARCITLPRPLTHESINDVAGELAADFGASEPSFESFDYGEMPGVVISAPAVGLPETMEQGVSPSKADLRMWVVAAGSNANILAVLVPEHVPAHQEVADKLSRKLFFSYRSDFRSPEPTPR